MASDSSEYRYIVCNILRTHLKQRWGNQLGLIIAYLYAANRKSCLYEALRINFDAVSYDLRGKPYDLPPKEEHPFRKKPDGSRGSLAGHVRAHAGKNDSHSPAIPPGNLLLNVPVGFAKQEDPQQMESS